MDDVTVKSGMANMDFTGVTDMLSRAHWSTGIGIDEVVKGAENSALVVGAFCGDVQCGYARVISDKTRFAYIADVFVHEDYRGNGIAQKMLEYILSHDALSGVYQWALKSTADKLYSKLGFVPCEEAEEAYTWMQISKDRPNR